MANSTILIPSGWSPRQYILAGMAGTLVVCIVIIVVSVILSPVKIHFSVTGASSNHKGDGVDLNFTLAADNPSHRAGVQYRDVNVNLKLYTANRKTEWIQASVVNATIPFNQPPMSSRSMGVEAFLRKDFLLQNFGASKGNGNVSAPPMSVLVVAQVRFKVGLAYSRPYGVEVSCPSIDFFSDKKRSATRVNCV